MATISVQEKKLLLSNLKKRVCLQSIYQALKIGQNLLKCQLSYYLFLSFITIILLVMKVFERKTAKSIKSYSENESNVLSDESDRIHQKPFDQKLEQLMQTLSRMKIFVSKLHQRQIQVHNNIIFNFCDLYQKQPLSPNNVVPILDKRIERMMKNRRLKKNWSQEDLQILVWTVNNFAALHNIEKVQKLTEQHWKAIADLIPGTTGDSCMFKVLSLRKVRLSQENWNQEQSNLLFDIVKDFKTVDWKLASQELFKRNKSDSKIFRNAKQCKEHWSCYLNPSLKKGPWTVGQDIILIQYIIENSGRKKWTEISKIFMGRTENALKNRYNLLVERYRHAGENQRPRYELKMLQAILQDLLLRRSRSKQPNDAYEPQQQDNKKIAVSIQENTQLKPNNRIQLSRPCKHSKQHSLEIKSPLQKSSKALRQETIILIDAQTRKESSKIDTVVDAQQVNSHLVNEVPQNILVNMGISAQPRVQPRWQNQEIYPVYFDGFNFWMLLNQKPM